MVIRGGFLGLWLTAVGTVLFGISHQDAFFHQRETPQVAMLQGHAGTVLVRPHGLMRWSSTVDYQALHDGDRLAVGRGGQARVDFGGGRVLVVGEDSQIEIKAIQNVTTKDFGFTIQLVRGTVAADVRKATRRVDDGSLAVQAGAKRFDLAALKAKALFKEAGEKEARKIEVPKALTIPPPAPPPIAAVLGPEYAASAAAPAASAQPAAPAEAPEAPAPSDTPAAPEPSPPPPPPPAVEAAAPVAPPPPAPPAKAHGFEVEVMPPAAGLVYWTDKPLAALTGQTLEFPLTPPASRPQNGQWLPAVELSGAGGKGKAVLTANPADGLLKVPLMKIRAVAAPAFQSGLKEYSFAVRGGDEVVHGKAKDLSFGQQALSGHIFTIGESRGGPTTVGFDRLVPAESKGPWLDPKQLINANAAPVQVRVAGTGDFAKLVPFMRGASQLGAVQQGLGTSGIFVVREQQVVAQLGGNGIRVDDAKAIMNALGGELVFNGPRSALVETGAMGHGGGLAGQAGALLDKGNVLYILKRDKLYKVSRDFIKTNDEVAKFIDSQAKAIFLQEVDILAFR